MFLEDVVLYTRRGCCLCDEAKAALEKHGLAVQEIDIDGDSQLRQLYTDCVPVVFIYGRERFRGRIDERLLMRILRGERL
jgi:glutaredoxin